MIDYQLPAPQEALDIEWAHAIAPAMVFISN